MGCGYYRVRLNCWTESYARCDIEPSHVSLTEVKTKLLKTHSKPFQLPAACIYYVC